MVQFPETVQREWDAAANAVKAAQAVKQRIDRGVAVEHAVENLRVRHDAHLLFQQELDADSTPVLEMSTMTEYRSNPAAAPTDLIDGVLKDNGLCVVLGPAGSGKSTAALQMLHSLMNGSDWLGQQAHQISGAVGILSYDMDAAMVFDWMAGFPNLDDDKVSVVNAYKRGNPLGVPAMRKRIAETWKAIGVEIIVLDSFSASFFMQDQNDAGATMAHYRDLKLFALTEVGAKALIVIAQNLAQLIESLRDQGGKHIYLWHSRKLLSMEKVAQIEYLALIIENDGIDPDYPDVVNIFRDPAESFEFMNMTSLAQQLGLSEVLSNTSADSLVLAYVQKYPNSAEALMRWRDEVISGADRDWSLEMIKAYDQLEKGSAVHKLLLSWVIKGLAGHYKSDSFEKLNLDYGTVPKQAFPKLTHRFAQPVYEAGNLNAFQEQEVRNQLDLKPVQLLWQSVVSKETPALPQIKIELNKLSINLNQPITEAKNKLLGLQQNSDSAEPAQLQKVQRTIKALEFQKQILEQGISAFDSLKDQEKIILGLFFASQFSHGYGESFSQLMISLIIKHYQRHENLKNQIQFLNDDIAFDLMNFNQFQKIIMMIETVRHIFNHDDEIQKIISDQLTQILIPLIKAKQKEITVESCDISFQKLFQVNKLLSFRSKWQAIVEKSLEKLEKQNEYQISVSKTILDAYYGDMGAVCLSGYPQVIKKSHLYNLRLIDLKEKTIVGNAVMVLAKNRLRHPRIDKFLQVFGINPLESLLKGKSQSLQLHLYLQFRKVFENLAAHLKIPIVLSGGSKWGILSNRHDFLDLILAYEKGKGSTEVQNVLGVSVYYDDIYFSNGILLHTK
jgi:hypothetical protein